MDTKRIAMIVKDNFEQVEMTDVRSILEEAGYEVDLIAPKDGEVQGLNHIDPADVFNVEKTFEDISPDEYHGVVLPGGVVNSDELRMEEDAIEFIKSMYEEGKVVAAICHAPWVLISAGIADGHTMTSYPTLQDDIRNAGGVWIDEEVVVDENIITSRNPDDIPVFASTIVELLADSSED